jgi:hypothetical protein
MVRSSIAALGVLTVLTAGTLCDVQKPGDRAVIEAEPDTRLARALDRWPNGGDLARLQSVEGKSKAVVLRVLGHPSRVERRPDNEEIWDYPWCAACRVWIRKGVCTGACYTAGY